MTNTLETILIAVGSSMTTVVAAMTVLRPLLIKMLDRQIESSFLRREELYKDNLRRSAQAYGKLLDKEFEYYDMLDEAIPNVLISARYMANHAVSSVPFECRESLYKTAFSFYKEVRDALELTVFRYKTSVPNDILAEVKRLSEQMRKDIGFWQDIFLAITDKDDSRINAEDVALCKECTDKQGEAILSAIKDRRMELVAQKST